MSVGQVAFAEQEVAPGERATPRVRLMLTASVQDPEGEWVPATVYDLSETGLLMECGRALALGAPVRLEHPQLGTCALEVVWLSGSFYGCQFKQAINPALVASAYQASKVVWPSFQEAGPEDRQQAADAPAERHSLGVRTKLSIIVGISFALWAALIAGISAI
jgi:hypothetical protein